MIAIRVYKTTSIYQLRCPHCNKVYRWQTGRSFYHAFDEHFRNCKYHNGKSKFAQHLRDNNHSIWPVEGTVHLVHIIKMGFGMSVMERLYYVYTETKEDNQINDVSTVTPNILHDTIIQIAVSLWRVVKPPCFDKTVGHSNKLPHM